MFKNPGTKWPIIIALSILGVVGLSVMTVKIAINNPVEMSDYQMQNYHAVDANINDTIGKQIAFDSKYVIRYTTPQLDQKNALITYRIEDKNGTAINDAKLEVILTRPDTVKDNITLGGMKVSDGNYTFEGVSLPKPGRWDIMAKVNIGDDERYFNLKADTRYPNTFEY